MQYFIYQFNACLKYQVSIASYQCLCPCHLWQLQTSRNRSSWVITSSHPDTKHCYSQRFTLKQMGRLNELTLSLKCTFICMWITCRMTEPDDVLLQSSLITTISQKQSSALHSLLTLNSTHAWVQNHSILTSLCKNKIKHSSKSP